MDERVGAAGERDVAEGDAAVGSDVAERDAAVDAVDAVRAHLARGAPWDACDAFRDAVGRFPGNGALLYAGALAHARSGAAREAHALLDRAETQAADDARLAVEIRSLRGRLWKDRLHRTRDVVEAADCAARALAEYAAAYAIAGDPYPGINAATLALVAGVVGEAQRLAREVDETLARRAAELTHWDHATAGEAALLLGDGERARRCYEDAAAGARGDAGAVASMRRQLRLIARALPSALDLLPLLRVPAVVAFAGHMVDAPGRDAPRFPAWLEPAVGRALRAELGPLGRPVLYASAACGADLIAIEAALELGAEVNVVLPFVRDDFVRSSVAIGGEGWVRRFDAALARADRVIAATAESYLGDDVLFEHAALQVDGLAVLRALQLETAPLLVCVVDGGAPGGVGGTRASVERWRRLGRDVRAIDLGALRAGAAPPERPVAPAAAPLDTLPECPVTPLAAPPATAAPAERDPAAADDPLASPAAAPPGERPRRTLKSMLFADFAGYSRMDDARLPLFQSRFLALAAAAIRASRAPPLATNTWGDALYAVFETAEDGADFALSFQGRMREVDWTALGLSAGAQVRIALHAGAVFCAFDPIIGRDSYFGANVTRAARIEPVTPPGTVYASEAFAATLAATAPERWAIEYVGVLPLAKGFGEARIYRLDRG